MGFKFGSGVWCFVRYRLGFFFGIYVLCDFGVVGEGFVVVSDRFIYY